MTILLATKLHQPFPPPKRVQRPHLVERLNAGLASGRQVTLVSAPAGFGKTTCVVEWLNTLDRPVTWLSLDPADDDPGRFFAYLVAALQKVDSALGRQIEGALRAGQLPPGEIIATILGNDILAVARPFLLVLDDLQVIQDRFILQVLERLLANLPSPLHLVLLSREDPPLPLARLRANNQLTEIRAADLRFTRPEAACFLNEVMGLSLSPADVAALETRTEGWIVGLQLASLSIQDQAGPATLITGPGGSHRFILSYLAEEVLDRQPLEIREFLLCTSILDRLCGDLSQVVTGRADSPLLLERLFQANLFLSPVGSGRHEGRQWYRYHPLFADLLRDLLTTRHRDETADLHRRASRWYAQAGAAFAGEAIRHALAAADYAAAVDLLERHATDLIGQGYAKTVDGWVRAIPAEWDAQRPRTHLAFAWMHLLRGTYAQAAPYLARLQATFAGVGAGPHPGEEEGASLEAEWLAMQALLLNMEGQATEGAGLATRALALAPQHDSRVRGLAHYALAGSHQLREDYPGAVDAYQQAIRHGRAAGHLVAEMMSVSALAGMALEHGQLHLAFEIVASVVDRLEQAGSPPPIGTVVYGLLGQVHYHRHELDRARSHIERAVQLSALGGYHTGLTFYPLLLSRLLLVEGDLEAAAHEMQGAIDQMQIEAPVDLRQEVAAQQVRLYLGRNRPAAAEMALQGQGFSFGEPFSYPPLPPGQRLSHALRALYNSSLRLLLHRVRAGHDPAALGPAIVLANRLIDGALWGQYQLVALEALLLRAQMLAILGKDEGLADYVTALELAEPQGILTLFVEQGPPVAEALAGLVGQGRLAAVPAAYAEHILAAFPPSPPGRQPAPGPATLVEPLSERELEVLRSMAEGLKYKEIAARLFISLNTVRSHVKAIYGKLGVNNRTQAIEVARQYRLL